MLPINLLSELVMGFAHSGLQVCMKDADEKSKAALQVDMETIAVGLSDHAQSKYIELGYEKDLAKTLAMVTMCACCASVMQVVAGKDESDD